MVLVFRLAAVRGLASVSHPGLDVGDAHTYLGLIHLEDGVDGALKRMEIAGKYLSDFGISTQCGWGRRPLTQKIEDLLQLHAEIGKAYQWPGPAR